MTSALTIISIYGETLRVIAKSGSLFWEGVVLFSLEIDGMIYNLRSNNQVVD